MINSSILQNSSVFPPLLCFGMWRNSVISGPSWTFDSDVGSTPLHRTVTLALSQPETLTLRSHRGAPVRSMPAISQKCGKLDVWNKGPLCCNVSLMRPSFLQSLSMATSRRKKTYEWENLPSDAEWDGLALFAVCIPQMTWYSLKTREPEDSMFPCLRRYISRVVCEVSILAHCLPKPTSTLCAAQNQLIAKLTKYPVASTATYSAKRPFSPGLSIPWHLHMQIIHNLCMNTNQQSQSCHLSEPVIPVGREPGQAPVLLVEPWNKIYFPWGLFLDQGY